MSNFSKLIVLKSEVCSDWPAIQCIVIGRIPQACDGNVDGNTQKFRLLSLHKHSGGVMQIFPHSDVDVWGVFECVNEF